MPSLLRDPSTFSALRRRYLEGRPFPHLVLDQFLDADLLQALLQEFPAFDSRRAVSENGRTEGKMVRSDLPKISPAFAKLHEILSSEGFLRLLSAVTGVEGLLFDPDYFGGGVHESLPGQELDPHLDFNVHPHRPWQRRLNVLLYLNPEWTAEAGGELELMPDPRSGLRAPVAMIAPALNRLVVFETNDESWHGHQRLQGPRSRRSIAAYYYTPMPAELLSRNTVYAERPLRGDENEQELRDALERRRTHLARLLRNEAELLETLTQMNEKASTVLARLEASGAMEKKALIECLDLRLTNAYRREPELQGLVHRLNDEIIVFYRMDGLLGPGSARDDIAAIARAHAGGKLQSETGTTEV